MEDSLERAYPWALGALLLAGVLLWKPVPGLRRASFPWERPAARARTVADVVRAVGPAADARLKPAFRAAGVAYPPAEAAFVALKREGLLELWARGRGGPWKRVHRYPILAASGGPGPKLREGDLQVPEGLYRITVLNPSSSYHLSLRVDYPNAYDRARAAEDGRRRLGGDIYIHGKAVSIGCLAMGDAAAEELFVLAARVGLPKLRVLIAPHDLRKEPPPLPTRLPRWTVDLYGRLSAAMSEFR